MFLDIAGALIIGVLLFAVVKAFLNNKQLTIDESKIYDDAAKEVDVLAEYVKEKEAN